MKTFVQKKEELVKIRDQISKAKIVIFSSFARGSEKGLSVSEMRSLKNDLRTVGAEYLISKKSILQKAIRESGKEIDVFSYQGSVGTAFGYENEQLVAKALYGFSKKHPSLRYFSAILGDKFFDFAQFTEFARLPAREVLIARLFGMMKYPLSALAIVLKEIASKK